MGSVATEGGEGPRRKLQQSQRLLRRATSGQLQASAAEHERTQRSWTLRAAQVRVCYPASATEQAGKHADALSDGDPGLALMYVLQAGAMRVWTQMYARVEGKLRSCS
jgi:hypothetical protein